jgi:beta-lactamase superfamily II metal-dependent hydrolase
MAAQIHLLNTKPGDCTIIQHVSGRVTMLDICDGNQLVLPWQRAAHSPVQHGQQDNFRMCTTNTNPVAYAQDLGIAHVFRFILSHPDMDHMDGFNELMNKIGIGNYWDSGARRAKPTFGVGCPYVEADWDRYVTVRDGNEPGVMALSKMADARFPFANQNEDRTSGGDGLYILAPDQNLLNDPNLEDDVNEGSYVILYRSVGGRILLPGDAHDASWNYISQHFAADVHNCSFLLAPHHGRDSGRSYDFLDLVRPKLTLIGCAPSEHIDYDQWHRRGLRFITSNQCGNVTLEADNNVISVYVENIDFAIASGYTMGIRNNQGYAFIDRIEAEG